MITGGADNDIIASGVGNDRLEGDAGVDRLRGGAGADTFVFVHPHAPSGPLLATDSSRDTVVDFAQGTDTLDVSDWGESFALIGETAFTRTGAAELRVVYNAAGTIVLGDTDGNGTADFSFRLLGQHTLTSADFAV